jgi:hypothetical protein
MMYINSILPRGGTHNPAHVIRMAGIVTDIQGQTYYAARFGCMRKPPDQLRVIPVDQAPKSIFADIADPPVVDGYVVRF